MRKSKVEKKSEQLETAMINGIDIAEKVEKSTFDFDNFQFTKLEDFEVYNSHVRKHNRMCLHDRNKLKIKVPDESFYKKLKIKFNRFDQPENVLKVKMRTKDIDWEGQLKPGSTYWLPQPVVKYLNDKAVPVFGEVKVDDGGATRTETKQIGERPRFSCSIVDFGDN